jgi:phage-related protein
MPEKEMLTAKEQRDLKNALEQIEELEHLMKKRPVETFKSLLKLNIPMELEITIEGGSYAITFNDSD